MPPVYLMVSAVDGERHVFVARRVEAPTCFNHGHEPSLVHAIDRKQARVRILASHRLHVQFWFLLLVCCCMSVE